MLCTAVLCMEPSFCLIGRTFFMPPSRPPKGKRVFLWKLELYRLILCAGALTIHLDAPEAEAMLQLDDPSEHGDVQKFHM